MFGDRPGTNFKVNSTGTKITTHAPAETAGTVDVTVTTSKGTSTKTQADHYTFLGPTIIKVTPTTGSAGTAVEIFGADLNGASSVTFGTTTVGDSFSVTSAPHRGIGTEIVAYAPAGDSGTVDVEVTTPGGTTVHSAVDAFTYS